MQLNCWLEVIFRNLIGGPFNDCRILVVDCSCCPMTGLKSQCAVSFTKWSEEKFIQELDCMDEIFCHGISDPLRISEKRDGGEGLNFCPFRAFTRAALGVSDGEMDTVIFAIENEWDEAWSLKACLRFLFPNSMTTQQDIRHIEIKDDRKVTQIESRCQECHEFHKRREMEFYLTAG